MKKAGLILTTILMCGCGGAKAPPSKVSSAQPKPAAPKVQPVKVVTKDMSSRIPVQSSSDRIKSAQKNIQSNPQSYSSYVELGDIYDQMDKKTQAADSYENALLVKPNQLDTKLKLAALYGDTGKFGESLKMYKSLLAVHGQPWQIKNDMANVYRKKKEFNTAIKLVQEILIQQKNNIDAINTLGLIYYDQQKYELAQLTLQKAIKIKVDNAQTHHNFGLALRKTDMETEAVTQFKKAAEMDASLEAPRMTLAQMYIESGNYNEAIRLYYEVLKANAVQIKARQNLGVTLMSSKSIEEAESIFLSILQIDPFDTTSAFHLGLLYHYYMQDGEKAVQYYQRFIGQMKEKIPPNHPVFANLDQAKKLPPKNPPVVPAAPGEQPKKKVEPVKKIDSKKQVPAPKGKK